MLIIPTYKDGSIQIWESTDAGVTLQRSLQVGQFGQLQLEGCVVDDAAGIAFIGEEEHGIWKLDLRQTDSKPRVFADLRGEGGSLNTKV